MRNPQIEIPAPDLTTQAILDTGRLFLRNLAFSASMEDIQQLFEAYGQVEQVNTGLSLLSGSQRNLLKFDVLSRFTFRSTRLQDLQKV